MSFENWPVMPTVLFEGHAGAGGATGHHGGHLVPGRSERGPGVSVPKAASRDDSGLAEAVRPGRFPVLYRESAGLQPRRDAPGDDTWAEMREAQALTARTSRIRAWR